MSLELPKRIFKEGEEPKVTQINNNRMINYIMRKFTEWMPKEELVTYKLHELWFVFARRPLRFSLQEFHAVTGFECNTRISLKEFEDWKYDGGFWSNVLRRKDGTFTLFNLWNKDKEAVVMDLEKVRKYPWGVAAYDLLYNSIAKTHDNQKDKTTSYVLDGFSYAFHIWALEAVPKIEKLCGKKLDKGFTNGPRCINWMGAGKVSYEEIIRLEQILTPEDDIYAYIDWRGNYDVVQSDAFRRDDDVEDDRIKNLKELIRQNMILVTIFGKSKKLQRGKKRLPDRGMEKRKHKVLSTGPKQAPFNEDMKAFVAQLFKQSFSGMEQRQQRQMAETFEQMRTELKDSRKEASVDVELGEPSAKKPSPKKPSLKKPSTSQPPLSPRAGSRFVSVLSVLVSLEASQSSFDVNFSQTDDIIPGIGTEGVEGHLRPRICPTLIHLRPIREMSGGLQGLNSPQSSLYYCFEESWIGFTEWVKKPKPLLLGPPILNLSIATRIVSPGKWLGSEEMDAVMFIWRVNATLKRWAPSRVAFLNAMFCLQIDAAYNKFFPNKKTYELPDFLFGYGRGELPSHGRTDQVWGVDVDRLYFPLFVNGNHSLLYTS
uniref:DUF1985 domain-containing protein n=1 Tax=Brassica oleracea var. oleracea TaxID=109376 RepID=A0A0D3DCI6_BRAOL